ncbi:hypothetical protein D3C76_1504550 [compost metagenome]
MSRQFGEGITFGYVRVLHFEVMLKGYNHGDIGSGCEVFSSSLYFVRIHGEGHNIIDVGFCRNFQMAVYVVIVFFVIVFLDGANHACNVLTRVRTKNTFHLGEQGLMTATGGIDALLR